MENDAILGWRGWSTVRRAQVVGAAIGALATIVLILMNYFHVSLGQQGRAAYYYFWLGMLSEYLVFKAGLSNVAPTWLWNTLSVILNTLFCYAVGTISGLIIATFRRTLGKSKHSKE